MKKPEVEPFADALGNKGDGVFIAFMAPVMCSWYKILNFVYVWDAVYGICVCVTCL